MNSRLKLVGVAFAVVAIAVAFLWPRTTSNARDASSAAVQSEPSNTTLAAHVALAAVSTESESRRSFVPNELTSQPPLRPGERFPGVVSGHVRITGSAVGRAAGTRVRCTPTIGSPIDGIVDANDRFEVRDLPCGRIVVSATRDGHTSAQETVFLDDASAQANVEMTIHELQALRVWLDDVRGTNIPFDDANANVLLRLELALTTRWVSPGEKLDLSTVRAAESVRRARELTELIQGRLERTRPPDSPSPWQALEFVPFDRACVCLVIEGLVVECVVLPHAVEDLRLRFDSKAWSSRFHTIELELVDEEASRAAVGVRVWVGQYGMTNAPLWVTTDANGLASLRFLTRGSYHLSVGSAGYVRTTQRIEVEDGTRSSHVRMNAKRGMQIAGRVESSAVSIQEYARVWRILCTSLSDDSAAPRGSRATMLTDSAQRFEFSGLAPGVYEIELFLKSDGSSNPKLRVDATAGSVRDIVLTER